jgi:hypothetical protein
MTSGMRPAIQGRMTNISSYKDLVVWQVRMDLADVCFDIVEAMQHPYRFILLTNHCLLASQFHPTSRREVAVRPRRTSITCHIR